MTVARLHGAEPLPKILPGFEALHRFWAPADGAWVVQVLPGEYYVTKSQEIITTVLGSCVSACVRDPSAGVGGINHFMLPEEPGGVRGAGAAARYGLYAIERLINDVIKHGGNRHALEVKICGGGQIVSGLSDIGRANIDFVRRYLDDEGFVIASADVGGHWARRLRYHPLTGQAQVKRMPMRDGDDLLAKEREQRRLLAARAVAAMSVELFK